MDSDQYDGMTQADTQTTQESDPLMDRIEGLVRDAHNRAWKLGQMQGLNDAAGIVLQAGHIEAANVLIAKFDEMND